MSKTVLLAVRPEFRETLRLWIQKAHEPLVFNSLNEAIARISETRFQIAVIDEDFDGTGSGWLLTEMVRKHRIPDAKIIVLGSEHLQEYYENKKYKGKFDWIMRLPVSDEQLLSELDREWPISD